MPDLTYAKIDDMETVYGGIASRARAELGVTAWGMQVMTLPPGWDGYPDHTHGPGTGEAGQEEVYVPLEGDGRLIADGHEYELRPGVMVRVGSEQRRRIIPGRHGLRFLALGGIPGAHRPSPWTELGGPTPVPHS
jgi:hypothetical protein